MTLLANSPIIAHFKNILDKDRRKSRFKTGKTVIFPWKSGAVIPILPWKDRSPPFKHS